MKKVFLFILLFCAVSSIAQLPITQNLGSDSTLIRIGNNSKGALRGSLIPSTYTDTTQANAGRIDDYPFAIIATSGDGNVWQRNYLATGWVLIGGGSDPSGLFFKVGGNLFPVTVPSRNIGTLSPYGGAIGLMTNSVVRAIVPDAGFTLSNDTTSTKVFTYNPTSKEWGYANWNNGGGVYDSSLVQYKSDTILFRRFNTAQTTLQNNWANYSGYSTYVTETPVAEGLDIVSTRTSFNYNASVPLDTSWESAYNDVTIYMEFRVVSLGNSFPFIGTVMAGATNLYANNGNFYINLLTGTVTFATSHFGNTDVGVLSNIPNANDVVRLIHRRRFDVDMLTIINITDGTSETFSHSYGGTQVGCATTNIYPGWFFADGNIVLRSYSFYGTGYNPDLLIVGASIQQNQMDVSSYDSSYAGRLAQLSNRTIGISAKCGNNLLDFQSNLKEIKALKPKAVILGDLGYNEIYVSGEAATVWQPKYRAFVDSLIAIGTRVVIMRQTPNPANVVPDTINAFIDSVYSNHPKVQILDIYTLVDFYHPDSTNKAKSSYFRDNIHWNNKPSKSVADQVRFQLERMERFNITGGTDVNFTRLNNSILLYQNTGTGKGQWNSFRLGSGISVAGDSINVSGSGGSSTSPAGNFGNLQINRNGAFATPGSDSLDFESATGLSVKGNINSTGQVKLSDGTFGSGGNPALTFTNDGTVGFALNGAGNLVYTNSNSALYQFNTAAMRIRNSTQINWASGDPTSNGADVGFVWDASGVVRVTNGSTGYGAVTANSYRASLTTTSTNLTLDATHYTVIVTSGTPTITLPAASSFDRQIYILVNHTGSGVTISTYKNFSGSDATSIAANSSMTVQSNGTNWYRIQ